MPERALFVLEDGTLQPLEPHDLASPDPVKRFNHVLWKSREHLSHVRTRENARAGGHPLLTRDVGSVRALLGSLSLLGQLA